MKNFFKINLDVIYKDKIATKNKILKKKILKQSVISILTHTKFPKHIFEIEICLLFADISYIQEINNRFRKKNKPTNVLSFPNETIKSVESLNSQTINNKYLGDIVICHAIALQESKTLNVTLETRLLHLFIHGTLHLLGYTHDSTSNEQVMKNLEKKVLSDLKCDTSVVCKSY